MSAHVRLTLACRNACSPASPRVDREIRRLEQLTDAERRARIAVEGVPEHVRRRYREAQPFDIGEGA